MLLKEFMTFVVSEESAVRHLQDHHLLPTANNLPPCYNCQRPTTLVARQGRERADGTRSTFFNSRCNARLCRRQKSLRSFNSFLKFEGAGGKAVANLTLCDILWYIWHWCNEETLSSVVTMTGHSTATACDWFNLCRDVPVRLWEARQPMGGPGTIVQIDETMLCGKRKNNKGRALHGDKRKRRRYRENEKDGLELDEEDDLDNIENNRNHGDQIAGPWVFGLVQKLLDGRCDFRSFVVEKRDRATLLPIILAEVVPGTEIHSDEWSAYSTPQFSLNQHGYVHKTVCHQDNFVDPT